MFKSFVSLLLVGGPVTAHGACDHLLFESRGEAYSGHISRATAGLVEAGYDTYLIGLSEVLARGDRGILFVSNHQSIIDGLLPLGTIGKRLRLRPLIAEHRLRGPFGRVLRLALRDTRGYAIPSVRHGGPAAGAVAREVIARMTADLLAGSNLWTYYNGYVQNTVEDSRRAGGLVAEILRSNPDVRVVLVRQRGMWGSRWSFADLGRGRPSTGDVILRGLRGSLANVLPRAAGLQSRRQVSFTFAEVNLRGASRTEIYERIQAFYRRVPEQPVPPPRARPGP